jgi:hypothetical protein
MLKLEQKQKVDIGQIRTDAPEGTRFLVLRDNHSATMPFNSPKGMNYRVFFWYKQYIPRDYVLTRMHHIHVVRLESDLSHVEPTLRVPYPLSRPEVFSAPSTCTQAC